MMIDYEYVDRRYRDVAKTLLAPAFRNIALSYCVERNDIYGALELYDSLQYANLDEWASYEELIEKYRLRLIRLINRLNEERSKDKTNSVFFERKVYDDRLLETMVVSYMSLAEMLNDETIKMIPTEKMVQSIGIEERTGFSVVEFALIMCLLISITGRSVGKLNEPIAKATESKRAKPRLRKIKEGLLSRELDTLLFNALLDLLARYYQKDYQDNLNRYITDFWLPKDKRHLKTADYAVKRYGNRITKTSYSDDEIKELSCGEASRLLDGNERVGRLQWFFFTIVPITQAFFDGVIPRNICELADKERGDNKESININMRDYLLGSESVQNNVKKHVENMPLSTYEAIAEDYLIARKLCDVMASYIEELRKSVVNLLGAFPESQIAGDRSWCDYFSSL